VEEQLEEENHDPAITTLLEETLEENPLIEPSLEIQEPEEINEDLAYLV